MIRAHLWRGEWIDDAELERRIALLPEELAEFPRQPRLETVLEACARMSEELAPGQLLHEALGAELRAIGIPSAEGLEALAELRAFLSRRELEAKVARELCGGDPRRFAFRMERISARSGVFESWAALGFLVHVAPSNAINVPFLSVVEGLLCGNVNFLKTGGSDPVFAQVCLKALLERDTSARLRELVYAARISSKRKDLLRAVLANADGVAAWGSEEALEGIRQLSPAHARLIGWGPKISIAYIEASRLGSKSAKEALCREICLLEQQACSSPQVVYVETGDPQAVAQFARELASGLARVSPAMPRKPPSIQEQAEITQNALVRKAEQALRSDGLPTLIESEKKDWRIFLDYKSSLLASPLFRTIWVKPLPRERIVPVLRPLRYFLQTIGLECPASSLAELSAAFFRAGGLRITRLGQMVSGYSGEPHDGVYALQRYSRRVSVSAPEVPNGISALDELSAQPPGTEHATAAPFAGQPLLGKEALQAAAERLPAADAQVFFKSGGSSGEPRLSAFTYDDYEVQMKLGAEGLLAAGLDPRTDRCMNLFFAGGLYGGFVSFFTILEQLSAVQFPMAAQTDLKSVGHWIIDRKVDTLLGMPSYLWTLLCENEQELRAYGGLKKIFYGGEHFSRGQVQALRERFGVQVVRSAAYGSNDVGPIGFQCHHCEGSVHHLHESLQALEILHLEEDLPAQPGEAGRLILTSKVRRGQKLYRYEIGDLGRWVDGPCGCGRPGTRFELLGRYGDVFKAGSMFLSYGKFARALSEIEGFAGEFQLEIADGERLTLSYSSTAPLAEDKALQTCLEAYPELKEVAIDERLLSFEARQVAAEELERITSSGKLRHVIDKRRRA